jgi:hypothetical protein
MPPIFFAYILPFSVPFSFYLSSSFSLFWHIFPLTYYFPIYMYVYTAPALCELNVEVVQLGVQPEPGEGGRADVPPGHGQRAEAGQLGQQPAHSCLIQACSYRALLQQLLKNSKHFPM